VKTKYNVFYGICKNRVPRGELLYNFKYKVWTDPGIFSKYSPSGFALGVTSDISPVLLVKATDFSLFFFFEKLRSYFHRLCGRLFRISRGFQQ
ncbi:hypothetical protein MARPO_0004s0113, partial [Marchantia polymorpha]